MRYRWHIFSFALFALILEPSCSSRSSITPIRIATSANMHATMDRLIDAYARHSDIPHEIVVGSSGKLTAQIMEGAPYDIFVAADMVYPQELFDQDHAITAPRTYALGKLVLWSTDDDITPCIDILSDMSIKHIAIANPITAPYGRASMDVLEYYKIHDQIDEKLVYGESISQTNQFILSRSAEIGITAASVVLAPHIKNKGRWTSIDKSSYTPIRQGVILIKHQENTNKKAVGFYNYLFSMEAKSILKQCGYSVDE